MYERAEGASPGWRGAPNFSPNGLFVYFAHFFLRNFVFALHNLVLFEEPEQALEKLNLALALGKLFAFQKLNNLLRLNTRPWSILRP